MRVASPLLLLGAHLGSAAAAARYEGYSGWIPTGGGGDVGTLPNGTSVADALAACSASALCFGVTYEGTANATNGTVFLKNESAVDEFFPYAPSAWASWIRLRGPCDVVAGSSAACVAAYSTTRVLFGEYDGPLYSVNRSSDGAVLEIGVAAGSPGVADAAAQDAFCAGADCSIVRLWDQSAQGNHLERAPFNRHKVQPGVDAAVNASSFPITLSGGWKAYGAYFTPGCGYRNYRNTTGVAVGNEPEVIYFVVDGTRSNDLCCFDFGNAEATVGDYGSGTMESVYFGSNTVWTRGFGEGPWLGADLENGIFFGANVSNPGNMPLHYPFILGMLKGGTDGFELKAADATQGKLMSMYAGPRPGGKGYQPMQKQGGIILGIGGDNSDSAIGTFFEGIMTGDYTTDEQDAAMHRLVVSARYGA